METPATMGVEDLALLWLVVEQVQLNKFNCQLEQLDVRF